MTRSEQTTSTPFRLSILHDSDTDMGRVMLRKRWSLTLERDVYEMTMDGKLMMSNAVIESERALAERALARLPNQALKVLIGGLGFGFTAQATLADTRVRELTVVERLELVIEWHRAGLLPWSGEILSDPRLKIIQGDFFTVVPGNAGAPYDAILIDIDDSPSLLWHANHAAFYKSQGLEAIAERLAPGGVLGALCATHPGEAFLGQASATFAVTELIEIHFENPCLRQPETNYILLAHGASRSVTKGGSPRAPCATTPPNPPSQSIEVLRGDCRYRFKPRSVECRASVGRPSSFPKRRSKERSSPGKPLPAIWRKNPSDTRQVNGVIT